VVVFVVLGEVFVVVVVVVADEYVVVGLVCVGLVVVD